jgi:hypothetical protein
MNIFETSATIDERGRVLVAGIPFAPGTEVDVKISPRAHSGDEATPTGDEALAAARQRMQELFRTVRGFRNSPRIAREELYERGHPFLIRSG